MRRVDALNEALARCGKPEIFNTDQASQFTSFDFTGVLKDAEIIISMDGPSFDCIQSVALFGLARNALNRSATSLGDSVGLPRLS